MHPPFQLNYFKLLLNALVKEKMRWAGHGGKCMKVFLKNPEEKTLLRTRRRWDDNNKANHK